MSTLIQAAQTQPAPAASPAVPLAETGQALANATHTLTHVQEAGAAAQQTLAQIPGEGIFSWSGYFEAIGLVFLLIAVLWEVIWLIKRRNNTVRVGPVPTMYIESRLALAPKKWVVITRFMDKRLVLGLTEEKITLLTEISLPEADDRDGAQKKTGTQDAFSSFLGSNAGSPN